MPLAIIKTGRIGLDNSEEVLTEYLCDWPGCPNVGTHVLGCARELGMAAVVCDDHSKGLLLPRHRDPHL
jgi:hypothetical protein